MPRVATRIRPAPAFEQGATRRDVQPVFKDMLDRKLQKGSKVPLYQRPLPPDTVRTLRVLRGLANAARGNAVGTAVQIGWELGNEAYDYNRDRVEQNEDDALEDFEDEFIDPRDEDPSPETEWYRTPDVAPDPLAPDLTTWGAGVALYSPAAGQVLHAYGQWFGEFSNKPWSEIDDNPIIYMPPVGALTQIVEIYRGVSGSPAVDRGTTTHKWNKPSGAVDPWGDTVPGVVLPMPYDGQPNLRRYLDTAFEPYQLGYGKPAPTATIAAAQPFTRSIAISDGGNDKVTKNPAPPHVRQLPRANEKESKTISKSAKIAVGVFKALDTVSEWSELVDAIYQALPADVRKRWEKGRSKRGLLDAAGQYGINGADWKIQALWHNFHKVDGPQAFKNIVANEYQDKVLGLLHKNLPRNVGRAVDPGVKEVNKQIEQFLTTLGF